MTADMFPDAGNAFIALGLPFEDFINVVNEGLAGGPWNRTSATKLAQTLIFVASVTFNVNFAFRLRDQAELWYNLIVYLQEFDAFPQQGSPLYSDVQDFLNAPYVHPGHVFTLLGDLLSSRLHSAFWFWGTAASIAFGTEAIKLLTFCMSGWHSHNVSNAERGKANSRRYALANRDRRYIYQLSLHLCFVDKYECASIMSRFVFGFTFLAFSGFTVGRGRSYFTNADTATINLQTSKPWEIASSSWV